MLHAVVMQQCLDRCSADGVMDAAQILLFTHSNGLLLSLVHAAASSRACVLVCACLPPPARPPLAVWAALCVVPALPKICLQGLRSKL